MSGRITHRSQFYQNYLETLADEIKEEAAKEELSIPCAAARVVAECLGYDTDDVHFVDGPNDRGVDFWYASDGAIYVYQIKTHELDERGQLDIQAPFNSDGNNDLRRAKDFLLNSDSSSVPARLEQLKHTLERHIDNRRFQEEDEPVDVHLGLIILGERLTDEAFTDLANLENSLMQPYERNGGATVQFHISFQDINDILSARWRQENREWRDADGNILENIRLTPMKQSEKRHYLNDDRSAIFYCHAIDLVRAYDGLGYQIFEPNVRAGIRKSDVNHAITESASHIRSMKEFRFLNNGITMVCSHFKLPAGQRSAFEISKPGVVNGLQTVEALHQAYYQLSDREKLSFENDCFVLVRLLRHDAVNQITDVVRATNNQNPMQPRNLMSNTSEQIFYARYFADHLNWFYQAKQGAWDAYRKDHTRWVPRLNCSPNAFKARGGYRVVDNYDLAQNWLAFLGFADQAANDKKYLFSKDHGYYDLIFLSRSHQHAIDHYRTIQDVLAASLSPDPYIMLAAYLARLFANRVVPSSQANRKMALERNGIDVPISAAEEARILSADDEYILNQVLNMMSLVFVEFVGYTLFRIYGPDTHLLGRRLLKTYSWGALASDLDWRVGASFAEGTNPNLIPDDLLVIMWLFFREAVETIMNGAWRARYQNERYKPRFVLNNRHQLYREIEKMDEALKRKIPLRTWTAGMQENEGFFGYVQRIIGSLAS